MVIRIVVIRDITHTTFTQIRGVYVRDQIIKGSILLGSPLTVGTYLSRIVSCLHLKKSNSIGRVNPNRPLLPAENQK